MSEQAEAACLKNAARVFAPAHEVLRERAAHPIEQAFFERLADAHDLRCVRAYPVCRDLLGHALQIHCALSKHARGAAWSA